MSSEDELDYMSDAFLQSCSSSNNDVRPGLSFSHSSKRKYDIDKKKKVSDKDNRKKMKSIQKTQREKMKEGMETPLDSSNRGFALMAKMGYKTGMSLGKEGNGIVEPVGVEIKSDRIGLGWKELLQQKKRKAMERRKKRKIEEVDPLVYRAQLSNLYNQKKGEGDLLKSRKICHELDYKEGILRPPEFWFWPKHTWPNEDEEHESTERLFYANKEVDDAEEIEHLEDEDSTFHCELESSEQLQILTAYLRSTYLYCIWCCIAYEDADDLEKFCPGQTRLDHDE